jgi:hypothetical protein
VSCDADPALRQGRTVAVTHRSIVLVDPTAPASGFSDAALAEFATFFDDTAYPTLSAAFGEPSDIDGNGRVIIFFTPAANALSPRNSATVVGGYFWSGDLFPAAAGSDSRLGPCATSAEAEILYLSVPDPHGVFAAPISAERLETRAVMGHEFQHLINAARRLHVNGADRLEEPWLNEGMSHIAEELLFYEASALSPRENIGELQLAAPGIADIFNRYAYGNVGRYNVFLQAPHVHSALGTDRIETRGATWSYLRYVLDREPAPSNDVLRRLTDSRQAGLTALEGALSRDPLELMAEWSVSLVADDLGGDAADPRFQQPSWDLKSIIAALRPDGRYPLEVIAVPPDQGVRFTLRAGGAGFGALRTEPGRDAVVAVRPRADGVDVRAFLVRVR